MVRQAAYLAAILAVPAVLIGLNWVVASRKTDPRFLSAGPVRRGLRWYRSLWLRSGAALAGWPHVVDHVLGTRRARLPASNWTNIWEHGGASVQRIEGAPDHAPAVLLVHSLISKPWILDLTEERSLARALRDAGFDTYLLDWGDFGRADAANDLSHYGNVLMHAEKEVLDATGRPRLHLVGYCLGGTVCLARAAARRHSNLASIALIATPCDFDVPSPLHTVMTHRLLKPAFFLDGSSCVPASLVRESFHLLRPQALRSVTQLIRRRRDGEFRRNYDALARWVWEHRRLPGALFFDLVSLFRTNALFEGRLEVAGELARIQDLRVPVAAFVAQRDHIVPSGSSHAVTTVPDSEIAVHTIPSGHVSMISGSAARETMWPRLIEWIERNEKRRAA